MSMWLTGSRVRISLFPESILWHIVYGRVLELKLLNGAISEGVAIDPALVIVELEDIANKSVASIAKIHARFAWGKTANSFTSPATSP